MKRALVLSGGGAKGAFQAGAMEWLIKRKYLSFDIIAGVSVGALNAAMLAMGKFDRLAEVWHTIRREDAMTGKFNWLSGLKMLLGKKAVYSNEPLRRLVEREVAPGLIPDSITLLIGAVGLRDGAYYTIYKTASDLPKCVLASTAIPIVWEPVQVSANLRDMVDGGLRNICPLGSVIDYDPDEIYIINCSDPDGMGTEVEFKNALDIGMRTVDILTNEVFRGDVGEFLRINNLVSQAKSQGITLKKPDGAPYKYFENYLIEPTEGMGETLDFSREILEQRYTHGNSRARTICP